MPKIEHPVCIACDETRSEYYVGGPIDEGGEQFFEVLRIILQVRVLDCHEISRGFAKSGSQCRTLSLIALVPKVTDLGISGCETLGDFGAVIGRTIIHDNDFQTQRIVLYC